MAGGVGLDRWWQASECPHGVVESVGVVLRYLHRLQLLQSCLLGYLVFTLVGIMFQVPYVGYVAHISHLVSQVGEIAEYYVESDGGTCMPQVGIAVDGRATHVHTYVWCVDWPEQFLLSGQCVVYE